MANDYTNSVPLGVAGTGAAYILPESQAINNVDNFIDQQAAARQRAALLQQQQAQQLAAAWKSNQLKIKGGTLYQPEINKRAQEVMQMGLDLQKAGVNPNTISSDPAKQAILDEYQSKKAMLLSDVDARDEIVKQATEREKLIAAHPAGYFDLKSINDGHDYISGKTPLSEITGKGLQMPELKQAFNLQPLVEKMAGVPIETTGTKNGIKRKLILPNEIAHTQLATGLVNNNPEVQADIAAKAGIPYEQIGNQTNPEKVKKQLDDFYRSQPNIASLAQKGIYSYLDPKYDAMITEQAKQVAGAAKVKADYINNIKTTLDNKVHKADDKSWDFDYEQEMRQRESMGMQRTRFADWKEKQQDEAGTFTLGNQDSFVPVIKTNQKNGAQGQSFVEPEKGASLYAVNLPSVKTVVAPSLITDMKTGKTIKNTGSIDVAISQIKMVPVFKGLSDNDPRNGSEISAPQLKRIVAGKHNFAKLQNITFQPYAYGISSEKDENNVHTVQRPIKFSYDALKGSDIKKINTTTFDDATESLNQLQANPKFRQLSPQDQLDFISKKYNVKLD